MAHTYPNVLVHCVFSTKNRSNLIRDDLREKLSMYFVGIGKGHDIPVLCAGGTANHAHLLIALPATLPLAKAIQVLKANSSRWLGEHGFDFAWQEGYGAFSVCASNADAVRHYIEHQIEHHAKHSFEDEFVSLLRKSNVAYDPHNLCSGDSAERGVPDGTLAFLCPAYPALPCRAFTCRRFAAAS